MIELGVNIDHVATLRQAPDALSESGTSRADRGNCWSGSITLHLREDRRHIQETDVVLLRDLLATRMNLESAVTEEMLAFALRVKPHDVCLVPEKRSELTTEGGLDVAGQLDRVTRACGRLSAAGIRVSLFIDPERTQVEAARQAGAPVIEIHTGTYADAQAASAVETELERVRDAAAHASGIGLKVNAGHGLHCHNVHAIAAIPQIAELNIGHAIVAHALFVGFAEAVREMKALMQQARRP